MKNSPAFPTFFPNRDETGIPLSQNDGLTKREYFAGLAMQGILTGIRGANLQVNVPGLAMESLQYADALIAELEKTGKTEP